MPSRREGFTLVELMIVVAILAVIAALAIPNLLNARKAGNEASCIGTLRTLTSVNEQYRTRFRSYANNFASLESTGYVDSKVASGSKAGYDFFYAGGINVFVCLANPRVAGESGDRYFRTDQTGVIRFSTTGVAETTDSPIE